ncbi:DEFB115 [Ovibos moschatus]
MLLDHSLSLSGYVKILFLAVAVLVILDQASADGWTRKCGYGTGNCRKSCKENEKKKEKCGLRKLCCIPIKHKSSKLIIKEETTYKIMSLHDKDAPTAEVSRKPQPGVREYKVPV